MATEGACAHLWNVDGFVVLELDGGPLRYAVSMEGERPQMPWHFPTLDNPLALPVAGRHAALQELNLVKLAEDLTVALLRVDRRAPQDAMAVGPPLRIHCAVPSAFPVVFRAAPVVVRAAPTCSCGGAEGGVGLAKIKPGCKADL